MGKTQVLSAKRQKLNQKTPSAIDVKRIKSSPRPHFQEKDEDESEQDVKKPKDKGKAKAVSAAKSSLPKSFVIVAGTYEKLLYGVGAHVSTKSPSNQLQFNLKPIFAFPAHVSCIKSVAASPHGGKWLATGSADEIIKVWDLRRRKEIGGLMHHQGSITDLHFPSRSHLLSASEDGTLCLFHARDWTVSRALKGHKARVNSVAVHPSGKVALSVGKDRTLRMWDLLRGKGCASTKLGKEGELVRWSTEGSMFVVQAGSTMDIYDTAMKPLHSITHPSRLHDVKFSLRVSGEGEVLLAGAEDKKLSVYEVSPDPNTTPRIIAELVGHDRRVKALETMTIQLPSSMTQRQSTIIVCTASSDGKIRVFDLAPLPELGAETETPVQIEPVAEYDTKGTRLTCITLADAGDDQSEGGTGKRKRVDDEAGDGDGDEDEIHNNKDVGEGEEEGENSEGEEEKEASEGGEDEDDGEEEQEEWTGLTNSNEAKESVVTEKKRKQTFQRIKGLVR
ncbi:WD40-repeat-containing domain protein [Amanita muscaria]